MKVAVLQYSEQAVLQYSESWRDKAAVNAHQQREKTPFMLRSLKNRPSLYSDTVFIEYTRLGSQDSPPSVADTE